MRGSRIWDARGRDEEREGCHLVRDGVVYLGIMGFIRAFMFCYFLVSLGCLGFGFYLLHR